MGTLLALMTAATELADLSAVELAVMRVALRVQSMDMHWDKKKVVRLADKLGAVKVDELEKRKVARLAHQLVVQMADEKDEKRADFLAVMRVAYLVERLALL